MNPMPDEKKYDFSEQIGYFLRRALQRHAAIFQSHIPDSRLTMTQFSVLCALKNDGPASINDLAKATVIDQATIRGVIDRLRARKLISVGHDLSDKRKSSIALTREGKQLIEEVEPMASEISERTYGSLSYTERVALDMLLKKMFDTDDLGGSPRKR